MYSLEAPRGSLLFREYFVSSPQGWKCRGSCPLGRCPCQQRQSPLPSSCGSICINVHVSLHISTSMRAYTPQASAHGRCGTVRRARWLAVDAPARRGRLSASRLHKECAHGALWKLRNVRWRRRDGKLDSPSFLKKNHSSILLRLGLFSGLSQDSLLGLRGAQGQYPLLFESDHPILYPGELRCERDMETSQRRALQHLRTAGLGARHV